MFFYRKGLFWIVCWGLEVEFGIRGEGSNIFLFIFCMLFGIIIGCLRSWFSVGVWGLFCINGLVDLDDVGLLDKKGLVIGLGFCVSKFKFIKLEILLFRNFWLFVDFINILFLFLRLNGIKGGWFEILLLVVFWLKVLKFLGCKVFYGFWGCGVIFAGKMFFLFYGLFRGDVVVELFCIGVVF